MDCSTCKHKEICQYANKVDWQKELNKLAKRLGVSVTLLRLNCAYYQEEGSTLYFASDSDTTTINVPSTLTGVVNN